ncbi:MAG TPA: RNA polymerase sigma factor [Flavitalea sp.]|nr:RNA polymerase sigma factor [Flavitalea sp.]
MSQTIHANALVKSAMAGNEAAWHQLYNDQFPGLYAAALKICRDVDLAREMVQDSFVTAYLKLTQLKEVGAFGGWIKKILIHNCYRQSRMHKTAISFTEEGLQSYTGDLNRKMDQIYDHQQLYGAIARLPLTLSSALMLRYFSEHSSYMEIANILEIPVGTVRSRLNQAKQKLTEYWQLPVEADPTAVRDAEEWNEFYYSSFSAIHYEDQPRKRFLGHLQDDVEIVFAEGTVHQGRSVFEQILINDWSAGSWLVPTNVISSGTLSIVESTHFNSKENPGHCPQRSILILNRNKGNVHKMSLHVCQH